MTSSCSLKWLISLFLVHYILITASFASPSIPTLIQSVCSKSRNPPLCNRVLSSDSRSARADIKGLLQISIDKTCDSGNRALAVIASLYQGATKVEAKRQLQSCAISYKSAMTILSKAKDALKSGGNEIFSDVISVIDEAESCDDVYEVPPVIPTMLKLANKNFEDVAYIVFTILGLL